MTRTVHTLACQADNALSYLDGLERWVLDAAPLIVDPRQSTTYDRPLVTTSQRPSGMAEPERDLRQAWRALTADLGTANYGLRRLGWPEPATWTAPRDRGLPCDATILIDGILITRPAVGWLHTELVAADRTGARIDNGQARDARDVCRLIAAAARRCGAVTTRPTVERAKVCKRKGCQDPDTGMPRVITSRRNGICDACYERDRRATKAGAA